MDPFVTLLKALADETRLKIMHLLSAHDLCVGALASRLGISSAAVSQHLQVMRKAGIVKGEKRGYWTHYAVEKGTLELVVERFSEAANQTESAQSACPRAFPMASNTEERRENDMCNGCCEHPEKLKDKPENCTPEQIKECHGEVEGHPCEKEKK
jgi:ArsR family transcriptional regulator, arsenate/arsenite/antimonite-responsive transcriptional repressor